MNKNEFLKYLEKRFEVLNEKEREDILNEYAQHIDMKMQSGLSEEEAIKDFGNVSELADEILSAYNVDPNYRKNGIDVEKVEQTISKGAGVLKKGASKIKDISADFLESFKFANFGDAVKFIIKSGIKLGIVLLVAVIVGGILYTICDDILYYMLPNAFGIDEIVPLLIMLLYGVFAAAVFIGIFINIINSMKKKVKNNTDVKKLRIMENCVNKNIIGNMFLWIVRIGVFFFVLPWFLFIPFSVIGFGVLIVFMFMGYPVIGLTIGCLGFNMCAIAVFAAILKYVYFTKYFKKEVKPDEA